MRLRNVEAAIEALVMLGNERSVRVLEKLAHRVSARWLSSENPEAIIDVHKVRIFELRYPYDQAIALCVLALDQISDCRINNVDEVLGRIEAKAGFSWKSYGEIISFDIFSIGHDCTQVELISKPLRQLTLVDYGKNLKNVEKILAFLGMVDPIRFRNKRPHV